MVNFPSQIPSQIQYMVRIISDVPILQVDLQEKSSYTYWKRRRRIEIEYECFIEV